MADDPKDARLLLDIGDRHVRAGATRAAIATYLEVARLFDEQHSWTKAIAIYRAVLKLDPSLVT